MNIPCRWSFSICMAFLIVLTLLVPLLRAGDNLEAWRCNKLDLEIKEDIHHQIWFNEACPIRWQLSSDGVVDASFDPYPDIDINELRTAIDDAFKAWEAVTFSNIAIDEGEGSTTTETNSGIDNVNLITWSDSNWLNVYPPPKKTTIAQVRTLYLVVDYTIDDDDDRILEYPTGTVILSAPRYQINDTLPPGTILEADMTFNRAPEDSDGSVYPYCLSSDTAVCPSTSINIRSVVTHEAGHFLGLSHSSLDFANDPATMRVGVDLGDVNAHQKRQDLNPDDIAGLRTFYPGSGIFPGGSSPAKPGTISGKVVQPDLTPVEGIRVWAYRVPSDGIVTNATEPMYETFTLSNEDWEVEPAGSLRKAGEYRMAGMDTGEYVIRILPWDETPETFVDNRENYNITTTESIGQPDFDTEFYDDVGMFSGILDFSKQHHFRRVEVRAGGEAKNINFITGVQSSDIVLVMDRSGSMDGPSGTEGESKLDSLKDAAKEFISYIDLSGDHRMGLVQFNSDVVHFSLLLNVENLNPVSALSDFAEPAIDSIDAGGYTNIYAGVNTGIDKLANVSDPSGRQILILFTDGKHNWPLGSNLDDLVGQVEHNNLTFYSIGYGDSINTETLDQAAVATGGRHVEDQDLNSLGLRKHFLSIAGSAVGEEFITDPLYLLSPGETAGLDVAVSSEDRSLTFVVHWLSHDRELFDVTLTTPGGCKVRTDMPSKNYEIRRGDTYQMVKVPLPLKCDGKDVQPGTWAISATLSDAAVAEEKVEILALGKSSIRLLADTAMTPHGPMVRGRLARKTDVLKTVTVTGEVLKPLPSSGNSMKQDLLGAKAGVSGLSIPRQKRLVPLELYDDGTNGDIRAGDGEFLAHLPVEKPGLYQVRLIATVHIGNDIIVTREKWTSFYFDSNRYTWTP